MQDKPKRGRPPKQEVNVDNINTEFPNQPVNLEPAFRIISIAVNQNGTVYGLDSNNGVWYYRWYEKSNKWEKY